jgi:hypothetical protein
LIKSGSSRFGLSRLSTTLHGYLPSSSFSSFVLDGLGLLESFTPEHALVEGRFDLVASTPSSTVKLR